MYFRKFFKSNQTLIIPLEKIKKISSGISFALLVAIIFVAIQIYVPLNPKSHEDVIFLVEKGWSDDVIALKLKESKIIRSSVFFSFYVISTLKHDSLQAGVYNLSPRMSIYRIASKMAKGDVIKEKITIFEGWNIKNIAKYLEAKEICLKDEFIALTKKDYSSNFQFLSKEIGGKPQGSSLEGYLFPDTYEIAKGDTCEEIINAMLANFSRKIQPFLPEVEKQNKTLFEVITMASLIEKEVRTLEDKKIVSGILWKRLSIGMALQLDATINYITDKNDASALIRDTKIDSLYNTYKYPGLPVGPISSPGIDSITAALYPQKSDYWYYLTDGITHFSKTFEEHKAAKAKYLNN